MGGDGGEPEEAPGGITLNPMRGASAAAPSPAADEAAADPMHTLIDTRASELMAGKDQAPLNLHQAAVHYCTKEGTPLPKQLIFLATSFLVILAQICVSYSVMEGIERNSCSTSEQCAHSKSVCILGFSQGQVGNCVGCQTGCCRSSSSTVRSNHC